MHTYKKNIEKNFSQASSSYDYVATVHYQCAKKLTKMLLQNYPHFYPNSILDVGTGTGFIPKILLRFFEKSAYSVNDISEAMLNKTKDKLQGQPLNSILGDMEEEDFLFHQLIISNLAFHWACNREQLIKKLYNKSDILVFSCLLHGSFNEWFSLLIQQGMVPCNTKFFPLKSEMETYLRSLNPKNCIFEVEEFTLDFSSPYDFTRYLKSLGATTSTHAIPLSFLKKIFTQNHCPLKINYTVFFGIMQR